VISEIHNLLKCPVSGEPLRPMVISELCSVNSEIRRCNLSRLDGAPVMHEMEGGYTTQSKRLAYPVREGIIVLLSNLAIVLDNQYVAPDTSRVACSETQQVQSFYDKVGWQKSEGEEYEDTRRFVDNRPVVTNYLGRCNNRVLKHIAKRGRYLVDVACGPIHYDAYRAMSDGYDYRICIDVSFEALREAKKRIGSRGIYLMADITNMPLRDESVDDVISLHTLYHVPNDKQITALKEIHRILKSGATGVVIYSWGKNSPLMQGANLPIRVSRWVRALSKQINRPENVDEHRLYSYNHSYRFIKTQRCGFDMDIVVWSSINTAFTKTYIPDGRFGSLFLKIINKLEDHLPHVSGRFGQYPLFIIKKRLTQRSRQILESIPEVKSRPTP
jgi:ubiquinone/menaquinone biosynthesis C-methylase UbiE